MTVEEKIRTGVSVEAALQSFRDNVNQRGTLRCHEHRLILNLDLLQQLLSEPITEQEAEALLDILYRRHWMEELIEWFENRPLGWQSFLVQRRQKFEEQRQIADEQRRRWENITIPGLVTLYPADISTTCPDCGSSESKPIAYGRPSEETEKDLILGKFAYGGHVVRDPIRHCETCFNRWPDKPDQSKPSGRRERIESRITESRSEYAKLSTLADLPPSPGEPRVDRAWARIDGSIHFLISSGQRKARVKKDLQYARLGGAAGYEIGRRSAATADSPEWQTLAAVAALRFERNHRPETHNLYNDWHKVQAHWRKIDRRSDMESFVREMVKEKRDKLSKLLKLARTAPEELPQVVSVRAFEREKHFLASFRWGWVVWVERRRSSLLESLEYTCSGRCRTAQDPERAWDLACAAALLADFPTLVRK